MGEEEEEDGNKLGCRNGGKEKGHCSRSSREGEKITKERVVIRKENKEG